MTSWEWYFSQLSQFNISTYELAFTHTPDSCVVNYIGACDRHLYVCFVLQTQLFGVDVATTLVIIVSVYYLPHMFSLHGLLCRVVWPMRGCCNQIFYIFLKIWRNVWIKKISISTCVLFADATVIDRKEG